MTWCEIRIRNGRGIFSSLHPRVIGLDGGDVEKLCITCIPIACFAIDLLESVQAIASMKRVDGVGFQTVKFNESGKEV